MKFLLPIAFLLFSQSISALMTGPGTSSGGGDMRPEIKPSVADVQRVVQQSKKILPLMIFALEEKYRLHMIDGGESSDFYNPVEGNESIFAALFSPSRTNVYEKLRTVKFVVKPSGPCRDGDGRAKAASAWPLGTNEICFSANLIREGTIGATVERRVLALAFHEMAHKLGVLDEQKLAALEAELATRLPLNPYYSVIEWFSNLEMRYAPSLGVSVNAALGRALASAAREGSWASVCVDVARLALRAEGSIFLSDFMDVPISLMSARDRFDLEVIETRAKYLTLFCQKDQRLEEEFEGRNSLSLYWQNPVDGTKAHVEIVRPKLDDRESLQLELELIFKTVEHISQVTAKNGAPFSGQGPP